jgi:hypothetical protein
VAVLGLLQALMLWMLARLLLGVCHGVADLRQELAADSVASGRPRGP